MIGEKNMSSLFERHPSNPILVPEDICPSRPDLKVECIVNPGAFRFDGRIGLLLRVCERPVQEKGWISTPLLDPESPGGIKVLRVRQDDPDVKMDDPRLFTYRGTVYLVQLSHLRLAWSTDGVNFEVDKQPTILGAGRHEAYGVEDCRVEFIDGRYWLTFTVVSQYGVAVGLASTVDWQTFERHGIIFPAHNKDCALFPEKIDGAYCALHRPSGYDMGGHYIWMSRSPDMVHWGDNQCVAMSRPGMWDSQRIGAGAAPIRTPEGWLAIYHGADENTRYSLGGLLLDLNDPTRVLARSETPWLTPEADYETKGFFGNVVFTNGHVLDGDRILVYYGAGDSVIARADTTVAACLKNLSAVN
jgi:predicted GH43/DUF377 family glycosyl hydrolase